MNTLSLINSDFDILFRNLFDSQSTFNTLKGHKSPHPVDIYEDIECGLVFEIACTGLEKKDIDINIENDTLRISHNTAALTEQQLNRRYQIRGIAKRSFDLAYRIATKFDLKKIKATMSNGLLVLTIPFAEDAKPKTILID